MYNVHCKCMQYNCLNFFFFDNDLKMFVMEIFNISYVIIIKLQINEANFNILFQ